VNDPEIIDKYEDSLFKLLSEMYQHLSADTIDYLINQVSAQLGVMEYAKEWLGKNTDSASEAT
jgi:hypothetical protein